MKHLFLLLAMLAAWTGHAARPESKLRYERPATVWEEALPLGNGRLGAMVCGDPQHEWFQLNEETVWGGSPYNNTNPAAAAALPEIRRLIFEGRNREAQELCGPAICSPRGANGMPYQTVGSLHLDFEGMDSYGNYHRELDLARAVATTRFVADGVTYTREAFASFADGLLIIRLTASEKDVFRSSHAMKRLIERMFRVRRPVRKSGWTAKPTTTKGSRARCGLRPSPGSNP